MVKDMRNMDLFSDRTKKAVYGEFNQEELSRNEIDIAFELLLDQRDQYRKTVAELVRQLEIISRQTRETAVLVKENLLDL